jgi:hypothetical protein
MPRVCNALTVIVQTQQIEGTVLLNNLDRGGHRQRRYADLISDTLTPQVYCFSRNTPDPCAYFHHGVTGRCRFSITFPNSSNASKWTCDPMFPCVASKSAFVIRNCLNPSAERKTPGAISLYPAPSHFCAELNAVPASTTATQLAKKYHLKLSGLISTHTFAVLKMSDDVLMRLRCEPDVEVISQDLPTSISGLITNAAREGFVVRRET